MKLNLLGIMAKTKETTKKEVKENETTANNENEVKEDKEVVKEDDSKKDKSKKDDKKLFVLWFKSSEKNDWQKLDREFKTETSANNHNIFVTGYKFTEVLKVGEKPE